MTRIIASTNATLDGAVMDPTGEEGTARGGWFARVDPADREAFGQAALLEAVAADAFLMGRRTYEFLAARWPARTGALAERLTALPKFVVSATLDRPGWHNTTVLRDDPATAVAALRRRFAGEIVVPASYRLVRALLADQLVDEVRIIVYPVLLGTGGPVFGDLAGQLPVRLLDHRTLGEHLTYAAYEVDRTAQRGSMGQRHR